MNAHPIEQKKNCSDCQKSFSCYSESCWCSNVPHVTSYAENKDCLCPNCLKMAVEEKKSTI